MFRVNIYSTLSLVPSLPVGCGGFVLVEAFVVLVLNVCLWTLPYLDNSRKLFMQKVQTFNTNPKLNKQKWQKRQLASYWVENHNPLTATVTAGTSVLGVKGDPRPRGERASKMCCCQHFHMQASHVSVTVYAAQVLIGFRLKHLGAQPCGFALQQWKAKQRRFGLRHDRHLYHILALLL